MVWTIVLFVICGLVMCRRGHCLSAQVAFDVSLLVASKALEGIVR